jgi:hypothetical protein
MWRSSAFLKQQPWIGKPWVDSLFILLPPFASLFLVFLFPDVFQNKEGVTDAGWVVLVLLIDVAHVYSTLYRTYFDPQAFRQQRSILLAIPLIGFVIAVMAYSISSQLFWRLLAYTAVFHFIRQQYGFMRVYSRKENSTKGSIWIDRIAIYYATLYPLIYWHLSGPRNFNWFTENDFVYLQAPVLLQVSTVLYLLVIAVYLLYEARRWIITKQVNLPKLAIVAGTLLSWYFGIVYFNGDMAFTVLNVVSHGIPYMALVWIYGQKNYLQPGKGSRFLKLLFSKYGVVLFLGLLFLFAYFEEGIWDALVWKEHAAVFGTGQVRLPELSDTMLSFIVPLLALPQITHYILDGFIWKIKKEEFKWSNEAM